MRVKTIVPPPVKEQIADKHTYVTNEYGAAIVVKSFGDGDVEVGINDMVMGADDCDEASILFANIARVLRGDPQADEGVSTF